jgi:hypothetical protein
MKEEACSRYWVIINYHSGKAKSALDGIWQGLEDWAQAQHISLGCAEGALDGSLFAGDGTWAPVEHQYQLSQGCDGIIVVGGDGTKTWVLNRLIADRRQVAFIGVQSGTMDVGTTSTLAAGAPLPPLSALCDTPLASVKAEFDGGVQHSFFDAVLTTTCIGMMEGRVSQFSARDILRGVKTPMKPAIVGGAHTRMVVERPGGSTVLPAMATVAVAAVAMLGSALFAQTLAGGADPAAVCGVPAGLIGSDFPLGWGDVTRKDMLSGGPVVSVFCPLDFGDTVRISGLDAGAHLVSDGNAVAAVDSVSFTLCEAAYRIRKAAGQDGK